MSLRSSLKIRDQRREPRRRATGRVHVRCSDPQALEIEGRLVDISPSGFRMVHTCVSLVAGQTVEFSHPEAKGQARVMWNRVLGEQVETGFFVVAAAGHAV
jgi:hypothetical protein